MLPLPLLNQAWTTETQLEQNTRASLVIDVGNLPSQERQRLLAVTQEFSACLFLGTGLTVLSWTHGNPEDEPLFPSYLTAGGGQAPKFWPRNVIRNVICNF